MSDEEPVFFYPVLGALDRLREGRARARISEPKTVFVPVVGRLYSPYDTRGQWVPRSWYRENGGCGKSLEDGDADAPECGGVCVLLMSHGGHCECRGDAPGEPGSCPA